MGKSSLMLLNQLKTTVFVTVLLSFTVTAQSESKLPPLNYPRIQYEGPNCFNFALLKAKALVHYRGVNLHEYWRYLNSPFCKQLTATQKPTEGDIVSVIDKVQGLKHAFVYLNEEVGIGMESQALPVRYEDLSKYRIGDTEELLYHHCDFSNFETAFKKAVRKSPILQKAAEQTEIYEAEISKLMIGQIAIDKNQLAKTIIDLVSLRQNLISSGSSPTNFFTEILIYKMESLIMQSLRMFSQNDNSYFSETLLKKLMDLYETIAKRDALVQNNFK